MTCCAPGPGPDLFEIRKVAEGVYAAVAEPAYKVNCNAAIIDNGDGLVVVDSHSKPSAVRVVLEKLRDLTPKPVRYVVNTHFHWDHWQGNEAYPAAYPGVDVVTTEITREAMRQRGLKRIQDHVRSGPAELARLKAELTAATTPGERAKLQANLREAEQYLAEVAALRPMLPTLVFERTMRLIQGDREIQLVHLGRAHTEGDLFVYLPREKVVVTGDAVIAWTPFMGDAYPEEWIRTLTALEQLDFTSMIMGHGDIAAKGWLRLFRGYIEDLVAAVRQEVLGGATLAQVQQWVPDHLAPKYEAAFSRYGDYRPWRQLILGNIERVYAQVS
jgi:glyoxylase-like metal-dependent hydrolase (beta-lactamase superfamily II)